MFSPEYLDRNNHRGISLNPKGLSYAQIAFGSLFSLLVLASGALASQELERGTPEAVGMDALQLSRIDEVVNLAIEEEEIPGAVVLVARKGTIVYRKAFGIKVRGQSPEDLTVDSIFDVASLTKVIATATSVLMLVESGQVALNDSVAKYIPAFAKKEKSGISLLQLLTHYSGLRPDLDLDSKWSGYAKAIELACNEKLMAEPGERFIYSDINYFMLGEVVREVSGLPLDEFSRQRIFEPLGMVDTSFNPAPSDPARLVPTEKRDRKMLRGKVHDPTASRMGGVAGHAGLFSTIDDIARWGQMILNGGSFGGRRILSPLATLKMTTPQSPAGQYDWRGLGPDLETRFSTTRGDLFPVGSFGHTGFTGTSIWIDPYTETLTLLFSSRLYPDGKGSVVSLRSKIASVVAAAILDVSPAREHYYYRY